MNDFKRANQESQNTKVVNKVADYPLLRHLFYKNEPQKAAAFEFWCSDNSCDLEQLIDRKGLHPMVYFFPTNQITQKLPVNGSFFRIKSKDTF